MNAKPDDIPHSAGLPGIQMRHISLDDRSIHDRHFIPNVTDFSVAATVGEIEKAVCKASNTSEDVMRSFLHDVAETKRELLSETPDHGKICVGLALITRFLNGAIRGNLLPAEVASQVPSWIQRIDASYQMLFLTIKTAPEKWIEFLNSHFGHEHRVQAVAEFGGIGEAT